jgi:hypothetical protein
MMVMMSCGGRRRRGEESEELKVEVWWRRRSSGKWWSEWPGVRKRFSGCGKMDYERFPLSEKMAKQGKEMVFIFFYFFIYFICLLLTDTADNIIYPLNHHDLSFILSISPFTHNIIRPIPPPPCPSPFPPNGIAPSVGLAGFQFQLPAALRYLTPASAA